MINRDNPQFVRLEHNAQRAGIERIVSFGEHADADARLMACSPARRGLRCQAQILDTDIRYGSGRRAACRAQFACGACGCGLAWRRRAARGPRTRRIAPARGRGAHVTARCAGRQILLIDESYNANPASMRAALALLGQARLDGRSRQVPRRPAHRGARRHAGTRAERARASSRRCRRGQRARHRPRVLLWPTDASLWEALPSHRRGRYAETSAELKADVLADVRPGDIVMVKGSLGSRMAAHRQALENHARREPPLAASSRAPS